ncbi:MAG: hypothetical protein HC836_44185 [Richelia sp. RM2_1_2]|nr:hypothetical protein [Richelia sp. RM2_1_2]
MTIFNFILRVVAYLKTKNLFPYIIIILLCAYQYVYTNNTNRTITILHDFYGKGQYNASIIPDGIVIYKSGVPSSYNPAIAGDSTMKYEYFTVGIWNINKDVIYEIVIPKYAYHRFVVGLFVHGATGDTKSDTTKSSIPKTRPEKKRSQDNLYSV